MSDDATPIEGKWTAIKVTEVTALATLGAFVCGLAYNASFFFSLNPPLLHLLSMHDHINSAISFIPQTIIGMFIGHVLGKLFQSGPHSVLMISTYYLLRPLPRVQARVFNWLNLRLAARKVVSELKEQYKHDFPDDHAQSQELEKHKIVGILICGLASLTILVGFMQAFLHGPWNIITVFTAMMWWMALVGFMLVVYQPVLYQDIVILIIVIPFIVGLSSISGYRDALFLRYQPQPTAVLQLADGKSPESGFLVRVLDGGVLLYVRPAQRLSYYPWLKVVQLEVKSIR